MNPLYTVDEITHQLQDAGATFIITIPLFADKVKQSASAHGQIKTIYVVGEAEGCESLSTLLGDDGEDFPENVEINPKDDIACLPYSSGTTGHPKGVMLTHYNLIADASIVTHASFMWNKDDAVVLGLLPFFHSFGQVISMSCALHKGWKVVCVPKFEPESFLRVIQEHKVSHAAVVPSTVLFLAKSPLVEQFDLSSLKDITSGGSATQCTAVKNPEGTPSINRMAQTR
ncbi:hypothetical protein OS493_012527 [Desmophyllum pertusum]|uniref:AMP-dependent synthetase/ligase domain-containing protein n=1 Tax=Desmophyllum pertusum TaxID=174260 RepID=A0A9X0CY32_9CNID|nr:hypothetical protein OS493_012527 [Desmophyllum pertusum]